MRPVQIRVEVPRWSFEKRDATGRLIFRSPLPCPWNYGAVPGSLAADGDELDAIVLGPRLPRGAIVQRPVVGVVDFLDRGDEDLKLICSEQPLSARERWQISAFFQLYARVKSAAYRLQGEERLTHYRGWRCSTSFKS